VLVGTVFVSFIQNLMLGFYDKTIWQGNFGAELFLTEL